MKRTITISFFMLSPFLWKGVGMAVFSQVMVNYGSVIYSANDTIWSNGSILNSKDNAGTGGTGGTFSNSGYLYIHDAAATGDPGDWTNNAGNAAFTNTAGVDGASNITCFLMGQNQSIKGTSITQFHNLVLKGGGVKQLSSIDAIIRDTLNLNDREFATGINKAFVTNTNTDAIQLTSGFVSSLNGGSLVRSTASAQPYLFPVGSSVNTLRYRPVEITPVDNSPNDYAVRLANVNGGIEGYPVSTVQAGITKVNPDYYHQITRDAGNSSAAITIYYDENMDGKYSSVGHWQNQPEWENIPPSQAVSGNYGLSALTTQVWDFSLPSPAFALIRLLNECGELFVPNAFSPDNNGENDMECVYGRCIDKLYFVIYDRWGEKVFETTDLSRCWDGTFRGKEMNTAVFVYYLKATLTTGEEVTKKGNISLLR